MLCPNCKKSHFSFAARLAMNGGPVACENCQRLIGIGRLRVALISGPLSVILGLVMLFSWAEYGILGAIVALIFAFAISTLIGPIFGQLVVKD